MTTTETRTMSLFDACAEAGEGGLVQREGDPYTVGLNEDGNYTLTRDLDGTLLRSTMVQEGWRVVGSGSEDQDETPTVTTTVREFFDGIQIWTFVQGSGGGTQWLYTGYDYDDNSNTVVKLLHSRYMDDTVLDSDTMELENHYVTVKLEDGETDRVADVTTRMLVRHLRDAKSSANHYETQFESALAKVDKAQADFRRINDFVNDYAEETGMCSDYERRIYGWNDSLETFEFQGREGRNFTFHVPVLVPAFGGRRMYVSVSGSETGVRSPKAAKEYVQNMSPTAMLKALYDVPTLEFSVDETEAVSY